MACVDTVIRISDQMTAYYLHLLLERARAWQEVVDRPLEPLINRLLRGALGVPFIPVASSAVISRATATYGVQILRHPVTAGIGVAMLDNLCDAHVSWTLSFVVGNLIEAGLVHLLVDDRFYTLHIMLHDGLLDSRGIKLPLTTFALHVAHDLLGVWGLVVCVWRIAYVTATCSLRLST